MTVPDGLPEGDVLQGLMDELNKALERVPDTQERLMSLSGTAWSPDGMVKAVAGPRGQLVDIEIDPRVWRQPDSQALRASVLAAAAGAARQVSARAQELVLGQEPPELAEVRARMTPGEANPFQAMLMTDADLQAHRGGADEQHSRH